MRFVKLLKSYWEKPLFEVCHLLDSSLQVQFLQKKRSLAEGKQKSYLKKMAHFLLNKMNNLTVKNLKLPVRRRTQIDSFLVEQFIKIKSNYEATHRWGGTPESLAALISLTEKFASTDMTSTK